MIGQSSCHTSDVHVRTDDINEWGKKFDCKLEAVIGTYIPSKFKGSNYKIFSVTQIMKHLYISL